MTLTSGVPVTSQILPQGVFKFLKGRNQFQVLCFISDVFAIYTFERLKKYTSAYIFSFIFYDPLLSPFMSHKVVLQFVVLNCYFAMLY